MAKVLTFSQKFPSYHPRAGEPTFFVEQVLNALGIDYTSDEYYNSIIDLNSKNISEGKLKEWKICEFDVRLEVLKDNPEKIHTIRAGHRWKAGDKASLRVWSGTPYHSPQIIFAPDVEVVRTHNFSIANDWDDIPWILVGDNYYHKGDFDINQSYIPTVAKNDGLSTEDLLAWFKFPKPFEGQIISWVGDPKY